MDTTLMIIFGGVGLFVTTINCIISEIMQGSDGTTILTTVFRTAAIFVPAFCLLWNIANLVLY